MADEKLNKVHGTEIDEIFSEEAPHGYKKSGKPRKKPKGQGWEKFKDGFGKFGMPVVEGLSSMIPGVGPQISNIIDDMYLSEEEKEAQIAEVMAVELEKMKVEAADRDSARQMQIAALSQDDKFSKRWLFIFSTITVGIALLLILGLFFVNIPAANLPIVHMAIGTYLGVVATVYAFHYGSSEGSSKKNAMLDSLLKQKNSDV
jgi:hypothetical protein